MIDPVAGDSAFLGRVTVLRDSNPRAGSYVLYWMQQSQRAEYNHALEYAVRAANQLSVPVLVCFGITPAYPEANLRHYRFMLEGLAETRAALADRGIRMAVRIGEPPAVARRLASEASLVVCDRAYLRVPRAWRDELCHSIDPPVVEVESDLIVPVETASDKREYAARTIRPKLHRLLHHYLVPLRSLRPNEPSLNLAYAGANADMDLTDLPSLEAMLRLQNDPRPVSWFARGGSSHARARLEGMRGDRLLDYEQSRSDPGEEVASGLSPYLHFGQISALQIALELDGDQYAEDLRSGGGKMQHSRGSVGVRTGAEPWVSARDAFLEELIVRRELAHNYVWYEPDYDRYQALPEWARKTLAKHADDERQAVYDRDRLERADTHDPYWNAAMREMQHTGYMHNYMRMYWGKKILEWVPGPQKAFDTLLRLNNLYFLDGRDANSYANVAWVFGLHDRPWTERAGFGTVRSMTASGLERKFAMQHYLDRVERLEQRALAQEG